MVSGWLSFTTRKDTGSCPFLEEKYNKSCNSNHVVLKKIMRTWELLYFFLTLREICCDNALFGDSIRILMELLNKSRKCCVNLVSEQHCKSLKFHPWKCCVSGLGHSCYCVLSVAFFSGDLE